MSLVLSSYRVSGTPRTPAETTTAVTTVTTATTSAGEVTTGEAIKILLPVYNIHMTF